MKLVWVCFALVIAFFSQASAQAEVDDVLNVQTLNFSCKSPENSVLYGACMGYVTGVGNAMRVVGFQQAKHPDQDYWKIAICGKVITGGAMVQASTDFGVGPDARDAVPAVRHLRQDPEQHVRETAAKTLERIAP